jgi:arginine deiminase
MVDTQLLGRREFLTSTAKYSVGAALFEFSRLRTSVIAGESLGAAHKRAPWVVSDIARLRRVIVSPPSHDEGLNLASPDLGLEPWVDREDWQKDHDALCALLKQSEVEVLTFETVLDEAIQEARVRGQFHTWLRAVAPPLSKYEAKVSAAVLMGTSREHLYPKDDDGNYRHNVNADSVLWPRDTAVMVPSGLVICNFTSEPRIFSAQLMRFAAEYSPSLSRYPVVFDAIEEQVLLEGGDVQVIDENTLLIGVGHRSEPLAAKQLARRLNMNVIAVQLCQADFVKRPFEKLPLGLDTMFMHLDTCCTHVNDKHVVLFPWFFEKAGAGDNPFIRVIKGIARYPQVKEEDCEKALKALKEIGKVKRYMAKSGEVDPKVSDVKLVDFLCSEGYRVTYVGGTPPADADLEYFFDVVFREHLFEAANVVATSPGHIISYDHCPKTHKALRDDGIEVKEFSGSNLRRGYGGPHCLTLPLERG